MRQVVANQDSTQRVRNEVDLPMLGVLASGQPFRDCDLCEGRNIMTSRRIVDIGHRESASGEGGFKLLHGTRCAREPVKKDDAIRGACHLSHSRRDEESKKKTPQFHHRALTNELSGRPQPLCRGQTRPTMPHGPLQRVVRLHIGSGLWNPFSNCHDGSPTKPAMA